MREGHDGTEIFRFQRSVCPSLLFYFFFDYFFFIFLLFEDRFGATGEKGRKGGTVPCAGVTLPWPLSATQTRSGRPELAE